MLFTCAPLQGRWERPGCGRSFLFWVVRFSTGPFLKGPAKVPTASPSYCVSQTADQPGATKMYCVRCGKPVPDSHRFCGGCGNPTTSSTAPPRTNASPPPPPLLDSGTDSPYRDTPARPVFVPSHTSIGTRDERSGTGYIFPTNPPQSPHACWLNLLIVGVGQICLGQVGKGLVIMGATVAISLVLPCVGTLAAAAVATIDAYQVGAALRAGRPVGKWEFFPSK